MISVPWIVGETVSNGASVGRKKSKRQLTCFLHLDKSTSMRLLAFSTLSVLLSAGAASAVTINLTTTGPSSDVLLDVGGSVITGVTSGDLSPEFATLTGGSLIGDFDAMTNTFGIGVGGTLDNRFTVAGDIYATTGGTVSQVETSNLEFLASTPAPLNLTPHSTIADRFVLSGSFQLVMNSGTATASIDPSSPLFFLTGPTVVEDFSTDPVTINPILNSSEDGNVGSFIDFVPGTTDVTLAVLRFDEQVVFSQDNPLSPGNPLVTLSVASINSIELTSVPEPSYATLIFGSVALALLTRRRR